MTTTAPALTARTIADADGVNPVVILETSPDSPTVIWPCDRCYTGEGHIAMYNHIHGGVCFKCRGAGGTDMDRAEAQARADKLIKGRVARARTAERKRLAKLAKRADAQASLLEAHPLLAALLDVDETGGTVVMSDVSGDYHALLAPLGDFVARMAETFRTEPERFTPRMAEATAKAIEEGRARQAARAAERATAQPAPTGRVQVEGEIVAIRSYDGDFGITWKMTVKADAGYRVFVTVPRDLMPDMYNGEEFSAHMDGLKGQRVELTVTLAPTGDDPTFAKGTRPTKARTL